MSNIGKPVRVKRMFERTLVKAREEGRMKQWDQGKEKVENAMEALGAVSLPSWNWLLEIRLPKAGEQAPDVY